MKSLNDLGPNDQLVFRAVHRSLAPEVPIQEYFQRVQRYLGEMNGRVRPSSLGPRLIEPNEEKEFPDNSAKYETVSYRYLGLERVRDRIAAGKAIAFAGTHNGALHHTGYAITRVLPETVVFTRPAFQYGKVFSFSMRRAGPLAMASLKRFLRERRPVWYYLDGWPIGKTVSTPFLGVTGTWSVAPIRVFGEIPDLEIVPVTICYREGEVVETIFHEPPVRSDRIASTPAAEIMAALLACLEENLRKEAPEQVRWGYLARRERNAAGWKAKSPMRGGG